MKKTLLAVAVMLFQSLSGAPAVVAADDVLASLANRLQALLAVAAPGAEIATNDASTLTVSYRTQTYKIHGSWMTGEISKEAHDEVGPTFKGFVLTISLQPAGEINQALTPQTLRRPYWQTYIQVTPVHESDKQLYWSLSYGSQTDTNLLAGIRAAVDPLEPTPNLATTDSGTPIKISLRTEKTSYATGQQIIVRLVVENVSDNALTLADDPRLLHLQAKDLSDGKNLIASHFEAGASLTPSATQLQPFELAPHSSYVKLIDFGNWQINIQEEGEHMGSVYCIRELANRYVLRGVYAWTEDLRKQSNRDETTKKLLSGSFHSESLTLEIGGGSKQSSRGISLKGATR